MKLNDIKLRNKFIFLYLFCVVMPIIIIDVLLLVYVYNNEKKDQMKNLNYAINRIEQAISSTVEEAIEIGNVIASDESLKEFINTQYSSKKEYNEAEKIYEKSTGLNYVGNIQGISGVIIYTRNDSIEDGTYFRKISSSNMKKWKVECQELGVDMLLDVQLDQHIPLNNGKIDNTKISLIRLLNYGDDKYESIAKLEINDEKILDSLRNETQAGRIFLTQENQIVYQSEKIEEEEEGITYFHVDEKKIHVKKSFTLLEEVWTIQIVTNQVPLWNSILSLRTFIILLLVMNFLLPSLVMMRIQVSYVQRVNLLKNQFDQVEKEKIEVITADCGKDEIGQLIQHFNHMIIKLQKLIESNEAKNEEKRRLEVSKKQAELNALLSQVNPHFMYNTLECICMRSLIKGERETADIVRRLSLLLREMSSWKDDQITIGQEMEFVAAYLEIQKYRFDEKISYELYIESDCENVMIPKLTLVSLIENACVHGIEEALEPGVVIIGITQITDGWCAEISDTGCGISEEKLEDIRRMLETPRVEELYEKTGTGILNTYIRLYSCFGERMQFTIDSELNKGTIITVEVHT